MKQILSGVLLLLTPALATAQSPAAQQIDELRQNSRVHVGPFYLTPTILLKQFGVDTNVFNEASEPKSDFNVTAGPSLEVAVPFAHRALLRTKAAADFVYFARYDSERSVDPQVAVRGEIFLNRITLFAEDSFLRSRQRPNFEIDVRSKRIENTAVAGLDVHVTPKFSVEVAARRQTREYDADAFFDGSSLHDTLNRTSDGITVTPRHRVTPLTTLSVRAERFEEKFPFSPERNAETLRVMPGVEFKPRAIVSGRAHAGYRRLTPADPALLPPYEGLVASLGLSYTLQQTMAFGVSYERDVRYSIEELHPYFLDNAVGASVRRALGRRFDILVSADRHTYDFRNLTTNDAAELAPRRDRTVNYAASLGYRFGMLGEGGRIGFGATWIERESTRSERSYKGVRYGTTVTYGF